MKRLLVLNVGFLFCCLAFQLFIRVGFVQQSYEFEQLRRQAVTNDERLRALRYSLASNTRSTSIMNRAEKELGLTSMSTVQIRRLEAQGDLS